MKKVYLFLVYLIFICNGGNCFLYASELPLDLKSIFLETPQIQHGEELFQSTILEIGTSQLEALRETFKDKGNFYKTVMSILTSKDHELDDGKVSETVEKYMQALRFFSQTENPIFPFELLNRNSLKALVRFVLRFQIIKKISNLGISGASGTADTHTTLSYFHKFFQIILTTLYCDLEQTTGDGSGDLRYFIPLDHLKMSQTHRFDTGRLYYLKEKQSDLKWISSCYRNVYDESGNFSWSIKELADFQSIEADTDTLLYVCMCFKIENIIIRNYLSICFISLLFSFDMQKSKSSREILKYIYQNMHYIHQQSLSKNIKPIFKESSHIKLLENQGEGHCGAYAIGFQGGREEAIAEIIKIITNKEHPKHEVVKNLITGELVYLLHNSDMLKFSTDPENSIEQKFFINNFLSKLPSSFTNLFYISQEGCIPKYMQSQKDFFEILLKILFTYIGFFDFTLLGCYDSFINSPKLEFITQLIGKIVEVTKILNNTAHVPFLTDGEATALPTEMLKWKSAREYFLKQLSDDILIKYLCFRYCHRSPDGVSAPSDIITGSIISEEFPHRYDWFSAAHTRSETEDGFTLLAAVTAKMQSMHFNFRILLVPPFVANPNILQKSEPTDLMERFISTDDENIASLILKEFKLYNQTHFPTSLEDMETLDIFYCCGHFMKITNLSDVLIEKSPVGPSGPPGPPESRSEIGATDTSTSRADASDTSTSSAEAGDASTSSAEAGDASTSSAEAGDASTSSAEADGTSTSRAEADDTSTSSA